MIYIVHKREPEATYVLRDYFKSTIVVFIHAVVDLFKCLDYEVYYHAYEFFRFNTAVENNNKAINSYVPNNIDTQKLGKVGSEYVVLNEAFREWFTFDYKLNVYGETPFDVAIQYYRGMLKKIDYSQFMKLREMSKTNFTALCHIIGVDSEKECIYLEDSFTKEEYILSDHVLSLKYGNINSGTFIGRLAVVQGLWKIIGIPLYVSDRDDIRLIYDNLRQRNTHPLYIDYIYALKKRC